ncbi:DMT family transporter [Streptomyces sp. NPDC127119]|uniref:DMT family transporter n=1 Tax=Streptomyces sp. NPDC127119 TaxID=3345370 RepID=UPI003636D1C9
MTVTLCLMSAVTYAGGAVLQERVAAAVEVHAYAPLRRPLWWAAVALNGLGAALHVVALAFGPLSLVQPLGALTIVFALPMAAALVGGQIGATAWYGAVMASVGLAGLLALTGTDSSKQALSGSESLLVGLVASGTVAALTAAALLVRRYPVARAVLLAGAAGVASGIASVFVKTIAVDFTRAGLWAQLPNLLTIAVFAVAGLLLSQASFRGVGLAAPLATVTVMNSVAAATVGVTLFEESFRYGATGTAAALGCGVIAAGGVILLTTQRFRHASGTAAVC